MKLVNLPAPFDIEYDSGTDFGISIGFPFALTGSWGAQVTIQPAGDRAALALTIGAGLSIVGGKLIFVLSREQTALLARTKQGATYSLSLIAPDGVRKKYLQGTLTIC